MSRSKGQFNWPHQIKGSVVSTRFGWRRETKTKKEKNTATDARVVSYSNPGRGANGESSN